MYLLSKFKIKKLRHINHLVQIYFRSNEFYSKIKYKYYKPCKQHDEGIACQSPMVAKFFSIE